MRYRYLSALGWVVAEVVGNVLLYVLWLVLYGCVDLGAVRCGQPAVAAEWARTGPPKWRRHRLAELAILNESIRGIDQVEAFLGDARHLGRRG